VVAFMGIFPRSRFTSRRSVRFGFPCRGRYITAMTCNACDDTGWVCEAHPDRPSDCGDSKRACTCGGAGMPCRMCNAPAPGERPRMPPGFTPRDDVDKGPIH
jgi:hypothetical protein